MTIMIYCLDTGYGMWSHMTNSVIDPIVRHVLAYTTSRLTISVITCHMPFAGSIT